MDFESKLSKKRFFLEILNIKSTFNEFKIEIYSFFRTIF